MNKYALSKNFIPRKSNGGIWSIGFLVGSALILVVPLIILRNIEEPWFFVFMGGMIGLIFILFGLTTHGYYSMKYIITDNTLILKWSIFKRKIHLKDIESISSISNPNLQGIRTFGVGIPGYLVGKFRIKFDGEFVKTTLFSTKVENLVIIRTTEDKIFGITPDSQDEFISLLKASNSSIYQNEINTQYPVQVKEEDIKKFKRWITLLFLLCVVFALGSITFTLIMYQNLPDIIPLHWGVGGVPNRFGDKSELLLIVSIFSGIEIIIGAIILLWMRRSDLGKTKLGIAIMLFPLMITLVFSILNIIIVQVTANYF